MVVLREQVYGNITVEEAREQSALILENRLQEDFGSENIVSFLGPEDALVHRHNTETDSRLKDHYAMAKGLERAGINVASPKAIYMANEVNKSFMKSENLKDIKNYDKISKPQQKEMKKQFREQLYKTMDAGYEPGDVTIQDNCGFDIKENKIRFYDVADWKVGFN